MGETVLPRQESFIQYQMVSPEIIYMQLALNGLSLRGWGKGCMRRIGGEKDDVTTF